MREIKFNFVYGKDGEIETYFTKTFTFVEIENGDHIDEICDSRLLFDYLILAKRQYTGLKDKNGVEIYEGDFVKSYITGAVYLICWSDDNCAWYKQVVNANTTDRPIYQDSSSQIVIGNIHQHPHLLEGNQ